MAHTPGTGHAWSGIEPIENVDASSSHRQTVLRPSHLIILALAFAGAGCQVSRSPDEQPSSNESTSPNPGLDIHGPQYWEEQRVERIALEKLYAKQSVRTWHYKVDVGSASGGFELVNCDLDACGAFYRAPPYRLSILSMRAHPLMLFATRDDCASAVASRRFENEPLVENPTSVPVSFSLVENAFASLLTESNLKAATECQVSSKPPKVPFRDLQKVYQFQEK